jgi:hypothetical protein
VPTITVRISMTCVTVAITVVVMSLIIMAAIATWRLVVVSV